jgi:hypothetical protein
MSAHDHVNNVIFEHDYIALLVRLPGDVITSAKVLPSRRFLRRLTRRLTGLIGALGERLFHEDDARALRHGWQIETRHVGLARTYRDPRFDQLAQCPDCRGAGTDALDRSCPRCSATGRIVLTQDTSGIPGGDHHGALPFKSSP